MMHFRLNRFNKTYVKKWLIAGERYNEPQLISFYNKLEMKQALMLMESGSAAKLPAVVSAVSAQMSQQEGVRCSSLVFFLSQLRSYSRHDLFMDPFEDDVSEVRFRRQRVEMERRVSSGCLVQLLHNPKQSDPSLTQNELNPPSLLCESNPAAELQENNL
ncbi:hypothetical protein XENOCAPTIV_025369 [Xenoophorus captivus]|uniref:Uncharacterized protein n=1 Tax=Xenoophorus captivus TaxID=1517983 RepID=A0ABV0RSS5_9TELE